MNTSVVNLETGEERIYDLPPREAVRAAWAQGRGDYNTWTYERNYPLSMVKQSMSGRTVYCGPWVALFTSPLEHRRRFTVAATQDPKGVTGWFPVTSTRELQPARGLGRILVDTGLAAGIRITENRPPDGRGQVVFEYGSGAC